jgi:hypothetical protein
MITEKQYKKALSIVEAYRKQLRENAVIGCFTLDDLVELSGTIQIPRLKEGVVDEDFASDIEEKLYLKGHTCKFVSLEYMGFISISFSDGRVTEERMLLVLDILNNR